MIDIKKIDLEKIKSILEDETSRKYAILGGTVLAAIIYVLVFILPTLSGLSLMSRDIRDITDKINATNKSVIKMGERKELLKKLEEELASYSGGMTGEKEISQLLEKISSTAKMSGVKILAINPSELKALDNGKKAVFYYEMPISISAKSGYHELARFIGEIARAKRLITIEGLKIRYNNNTPRKHDVNIVLKTYVSAEEGESGEK